MSHGAENTRWHQFHTRGLLVTTAIVAGITAAYCAHAFYGWLLGTVLGAFLAGGLHSNDIFETNSFRAFFGSGAGGALSAGSQAALIFIFGGGFHAQAIVFSVMIGIVGGGIGFLVSIAWGIAGLWIELVRDRVRQHHPSF